MAIAKLSLAQAMSINLARAHANDADRKAIKREIFAAVKQSLGIPADTKLKVETHDTAAADYLVIKDKNDNTFNLDALACGTGRAAVAPVPTRWFLVSDLKHVLADLVRDAGADWDDGEEFVQADSIVLADVGGVAFDPVTGYGYVLLPQSDFV
jgi:hypothetical protein